jgi:hypothetical protein
VNGFLCAVCILGAAFAQVFQPFSLRLGSLNQCCVLVAYLTG